MDRKDVEYLRKFRESFDVRDLLTYFAFYAWEKLEQRSMHLNKVNEEGITTQLVEEILYALCSKNAILPVRFFDSKKESANGNDLEVVLPVDSTRSIILPCQAKKLNVKSGKDNLEAKYEQIDHVVGKGLSKKFQIDSLLEYAKKVKGFPIYLFYNYTEQSVDTKGNYRQKQLYGTTIASASFVHENFYNQELEKVTPFKFQDIHPPARPLISILDPDFIPKLNTYIGAAKSHFKLKLYSDKELMDQDWWDEKCPPFGQPKRRSSFSSIDEILTTKPGGSTFEPKYRIQILREPIFHRQINIKYDPN